MQRESKSFTPYNDLLNTLVKHVSYPFLGVCLSVTSFSSVCCAGEVLRCLVFTVFPVHFCRLK